MFLSHASILCTVLGADQNKESRGGTVYAGRWGMGSRAVGEQINRDS